MEDLRYPIGPIDWQPYSEAVKEEKLSDIRFLPNVVESLVQDLNEEQLHQPYRPGGWTIHQLVHHLADSHMNAFIRCKLALTEDAPTIKPYMENEWVRTADVSKVPVNLSITLLFSLHARWHQLLSDVKGNEWERTVFHPEQQKQLSLWDLLVMYAWHCRHHAAHIRNWKERENLL